MTKEKAKKNTPESKKQENNQTTTDVRGLILDILLEILEKDSYSHMVLKQALDKYQYLEKQDRALITKVTEGVLEYLIQIDYVIELYSSIKISKMKPLIRTLLRMSVYQILYLDRIPDSAVCNEAVKLAKKRRFQGLSGFVNGVLRTISREKENLNFPDDSIRYSAPWWLINLWKESYPEETVREMLGSFLEKSRLSVRCNLEKADKEQIIHSLKQQGVKVWDSGYLEAILYLEGIDYLEALEAFQKGWIFVQDLSSSLVALAVAPQKGSYCIDVCGAPGGKALHLADLLSGTGTVEVRDINEHKVELIQENIRRSGFSNIKSKIWDAFVLDQDSVEKADLVLADLPCSGLGVIGRKPDIKRRMSLEAMEELAKLQREILSVVWKYVKPGGTLVYSTCTVNQKENEDNARWFTQNFPFRTVNIERRLGEKLKSETMRQGYIQLLPGKPCDGFFLAVFERI